MAYLHCHSCDWSQDDFYTKSYNVWTKIWSDIKWLWIPRITNFDDHGRQVSCLMDYTRIPVIHWRKGNLLYVFSWSWLLLEIVKDIKVYRKTVWKTWKQWKAERDTAVCPKCGDRNFDID